MFEGARVDANLLGDRAAPERFFRGAEDPQHLLGEGSGSRAT